MKRILSFVAVLVSLWFIQPHQADAQGTPSEGKDFYLGLLFPSYQNVVPSFSQKFFSIYVLISSFQDNTAYVSYFDPATGQEESPNSYQIKGRRTVQIQLIPGKMRMEDPGDILKEFKSLHITAKKPVNVQFFSSGPNSCGAYLALPTNGLGTKYVVASYNDDPESVNGQIDPNGTRGPTQIEPGCGYFMVIGAFDGTTVVITPTSTTQGGKHPGKISGPGADGSPKPYSISLNRGQCYLVKSWCSNFDNDISGTTVESSKPVAVLAGHEDLSLGGVSGRTLEGRDYMIEQMTPVDYWDTTGYVSMPLVDSSPLGPNDDPPGDTYRTYTFSENGAHPKMKITGFGGVRDMDVSKYTTSEQYAIDDPVHISSGDSVKFGVMLYDQANHSINPPFPRPSMMTIVPMSRWRNAYLWFVPPNLSGERLQVYYMNIIGPKAKFDSILVSKDGSKPAPISSLGSIQGQYNSFPDHPELIGKRYKVTSGVTYYANANFPFMVYSYGTRACDFDGDLGDFDRDDYFYTYATPVGMVLSNGVPPNMTITVDTLCSSWHVCVTDHRAGGGIKSAVLLDDPFGDIVIPPPGKPGYQYNNCYFDPALDPLNLHEVTFAGTDSTECFDIYVANAGKDAYAPLYITDNAGNAKLIELNFQKSQVAYNPQPDTDCYFGLHYILDTKDSTFIFTNLPTSKKSYVVSKVELMKNDPAFQIVSITPPLTATIKPGDTLFIKVRFTAIDTTVHFDTVKMVTDCFTSLTPISGEGGTPLIVAADHNFGNVGVGSKSCVDTITVWNLGKLPFILDKNYKLYDNVNFSIDPAYPLPFGLPVTILPGKSVKVKFCYSPSKVGTDTTRNDWGTDIRPPYEHSIKDYTILKGNGIKPGVIWDRALDSMVVLCDSSLIHRVNLLNNANATAHVKDVYFTGPDAGDFTIVGWQFGNPPYDFSLDPGDTSWFDVKFKADLSKPYQLRQAYLNASTFNDTDVRVINMRGWVQKAAVLVNPTPLLDMQVIPIATPTPGGFSLENTGDGILYINGIILPSEIAITNPPPPIAYPIVLQPGEKIGVSISLVSNIYVDSTIPIKFICESPCSPDDTLWVHYLVSKREVIPAGFTFPDTYIDCRESNGTVSLTNKGTTPINLHSVEFISDPPTYVDPDQFVFQSNGTQLLNYAPVLAIAPGKTETIPVVFKPTRTGALGTKVRFAYDSAGIVKDTVYAINVGNGVKLKNTFNVANAGGPFKYETGQFFDLPITLTDPIENNAGVYGSKFTVTYKRDVIDFKSVRGEGNQTIVGTPTPVPDGSGNETITIETRGGQITQAGAVASIHFLVVVAKDKQTDIVVADGELKDNVGATLCYFDKQYVPGSFEPIYLCGDPSLNQYLNGAFKPTKITQLTPNPSNGTGKVTLSYDVNVKDLPITVELFNVMGDKVQTLVDKKTMTEGGHTLSISTKNIPAGTYTVRISANNDSESENFVITK